MLTDPARFGGDPRDAFTVVAPSMPGHGFSFKPNQRRFSILEIGDTLAKLMIDVLGYKTFGSQGGDWGAFVSSRLGYAYPRNVSGIQISLLTIPRERPAIGHPTAEENQFFEQLADWLREETRLYPDHGHEAPDIGLCALGFSGGSRRMDTGETQVLDGLQRRS